MAHENLGALFLETGRPEDAIEQFNKTLAIKADDASAEANLGNAFLQMGSWMKLSFTTKKLCS